MTRQDIRATDNDLNDEGNAVQWRRLSRLRKERTECVDTYWSLRASQ